MNTEHMPRYQCHKKVWALKIKDIQQSDADIVCDGGSWTISVEGSSPFTVPHGYVEKHKPHAGGYYVVYEDGYSSFSPAGAFESGYARI